MITMISWNAGEISAFMIVSNLNKVAIATTLPMLIKAVVKVGAFINIRRPKWKGTAAILKNIPIVTSIIPIETKLVVQQCDNSNFNIKASHCSVYQADTKSIIPDAKIPSRNTLNQLRYFLNLIYCLPLKCMAIDKTSIPKRT
jgi:hypothetical protein